MKRLPGMKPGGSNEEKNFVLSASYRIPQSFILGGRAKGEKGKFLGKENSSERNRQSFDTILSQFLFSFLIYIIDTKE